MVNDRPSFDSLPLRKDGPPGNAWGLYGDTDEIGALNMLTPEVVANASKEIKEGFRVSTDWPLNSMKRPCFGRDPMEHKVWQKPGRVVHDDEVRFNTQCSSQWDGFRHFGYQKEAVFYNGRTLEDIHSSDVLGIHSWVERGGVVGRGVLLDYASWAEEQGISYPCFETHSIPVSHLQEVATAQGTTFLPGDILFIRTGWIPAYEKLSDSEQTQLADMKTPPAVGIESSKDTLRWLWDCKFSAVVGDHPSMEAWPPQSDEFYLHVWLLAGWGMPIGELFNLEKLADECKKRQRWTFFFSSMPLNVPGGVASPPNGIAIF